MRLWSRRISIRICAAWLLPALVFGLGGRDNRKLRGGDRMPDYSIVFPENAVNRIDLSIGAENWQKLLDDMKDHLGQFGGDDIRGHGGRRGGTGDEDNPSYVPCTVRFAGREWTSVGVRFKGNNSLRTAWSAGNLKMAIHLDFGKFKGDDPEAKGRRFYGFSELTFSNNFGDPSLLSDRIAPDIFRASGVPAPRTAFYRLFIDHGNGLAYFGVYTAVEVIEDTMLKTQFGSKKGNCYKPVGIGATFAAGTFGQEYFLKKTNVNAADWSDIIDLFSVLHSRMRTTAPAAWRAKLETVFNVGVFLRWLAANTVMQNWDTYGNIRHNYFLYADPAGSGLTWIPWDNNQALRPSSRALSLDLAEVNAKWPLIRFLLDDPLYRERYRAGVAFVIAGAFAPLTMETVYRRLHALIAPYVVGPEGERIGFTYTTPAAFDDSLEALIRHNRDRCRAARNYLGDTNPPPAFPAAKTKGGVMKHFHVLDILLRLAYNLFTAFIIIRCIYYPKERKREYLFTFFVFNMMIFLVCTFMKHILMNIGFAFGLFAIFSILRYRTECIPIREMTFQFLVITLGALNGLADVGTWHPELVVINSVVLVMVLILDGKTLMQEEFTQTVRYEKIELIRPSRAPELLADLRERTGLDIYRTQIKKIDFLNDSAEITVFYRDGSEIRHTQETGNPRVSPRRSS